MATLKDRIVEYAGSTRVPADDTITQYIQDGIRDVVTKLISIEPSNSIKFSREYTISDSNGTEIIKDGIVSSVFIKDTADTWNKATPIDPSLKHSAIDSDSMYLTSVAEPVYYIENNKIYILPAPSASTEYLISAYGDNGGKTALTSAENTEIKAGDLILISTCDVPAFNGSWLVISTAPGSSVTYVTLERDWDATDATPSNFGKYQGSQALVSMPGYDVSAAHGSTDIDFMPKHEEHMVIMYASIRSLLDHINTLLPYNGDATLPVSPVAPSLDFSVITQALAEMTLPASFVPPILEILPQTTLSWDFPSEPVAPDLTGTSDVGSLGTAPTYTGPVVYPDILNAESYLTDEDVELVVSRLQIIDRQLQEYQAATQNAVNRFQKENAIYQADLQVKIQEAQLSNTVDGNKLQKYSVDIQRYSQTIQSLVSKNQAIVNEWQVEWNVKIQKYSSEISAEINRYQADISLQSQITQSKVANYNAQIARASSEHQAQLNKYQAESGAYNAEIQKYQVESANEMQIHAKKIADVQSQLAQIQQLYLSSFTAKGAQ